MRRKLELVSGKIVTVISRAHSGNPFIGIYPISKVIRPIVTVVTVYVKLLTQKVLEHWLKKPSYLSSVTGLYMTFMVLCAFIWQLQQAQSNPFSALFGGSNTSGTGDLFGWNNNWFLLPKLWNVDVDQRMLISRLIVSTIKIYIVIFVNILIECLLFQQCSQILLKPTLKEEQRIPHPCQILGLPPARALLQLLLVQHQPPLRP